jgi:hypothetical protein
MNELDEMVRNPAAYPKLQGEGHAHALRNEFEKYVTATILDGEGTLMAFLTETFTFANRYTAPAYGVSLDTDEMTKIELPKERRSGVLTLASVMAVLSSTVDPGRDRPVLRAKLISERFFCKDIGLPSGLDLGMAREKALEKTPDFDQLTVREQFETVMQQSQTCMNCHMQFMPYGFALSNYNAVGEYVTQQNNRPINSSVTVAVGNKQKSFDGPVTFIKDLSEDERVYKCFTRNMVRYMMGVSGGPHVDDLTLLFYRSFKKNYFDVNQLLETMFTSSFVYQRDGVGL